MTLNINQLTERSKNLLFLFTYAKYNVLSWISVSLLSGLAPTERPRALASNLEAHMLKMDKSEHQPTPSYLRERAAFYRERARQEPDQAKAAEYRYIADVFDREADASEGE